MKQRMALRSTTSLTMGTLALSVLGALPLATAAQAQRFQITLNTASLVGTTGSLDFQFNPGDQDSQNAALQVTGFTTTGTLAGTAQDTGGGAGALPGALTIANNGSLNEVFQRITFGSALSFFAIFSGLAITSPTGAGVGSTFAFTPYNNSGIPIGNNFDASVLDIDVNPDGSQTITSGSAALSVTPAPVPEASSALSLGLLLALGVGGLSVARRKRACA